MVKRVKDLIEWLMVPVDDDELKQRQLSELARIRRGRWRDWTPRPMLAASLPPPPPINEIDNDGFVQQVVSTPMANVVYMDPTIEPNGYVPMVWP